MTGSPPFNRGSHEDQVSIEHLGITRNFPTVQRQAPQTLPKHHGSILSGSGSRLRWVRFNIVQAGFNPAMLAMNFCRGWAFIYTSLCCLHCFGWSFRAVKGNGWKWFVHLSFKHINTLRCLIEITVCQFELEKTVRSNMISWTNP